MQKVSNITKTEKDFMKIPLFRSVKQINGQKIFKILYQASKILSYSQQTIDKQLSCQQNFIYVKQGGIKVYKIRSDSNDKNLFKSYRVQEYCGFQDYPLFWGQALEVQVAAHSQLIIVPLQQFYAFFRRVIPMTYLQLKADYLKKLPLFRDVQQQKIMKLACISHKYRVPKQTILANEGQQITNIYLICSGKLQLKSSLISDSIICRQNQDFLVKQIRQNIPTCHFTARCIMQSDILTISSSQFKRLLDPQSKSYRNISQDIQFKQKTQHSLEQQHTFKQLKQNLPSPFARQQHQHYKTYYGKLRIQKNPLKRQIKSAYKPRQKINLSTQNSQQLKFPQHIKSFSLSEFHRQKFIKRKERIQNKNFIKYIESRAPQIVLNPSKQFAIVKPLYISSSQYVRNMKRKIRRSQHLQKINHFNGPSTSFDTY